MIDQLIPSPLGLALSAVLLLDWWVNRRRLIWYAGPVAVLSLLALSLGERFAVDILTGGGLAGLTILILVRLPTHWLEWRFQRSLWIRPLSGRGASDPALVGQRAAFLNRVASLRGRVRPGLVITAAALWDFVSHTEIESILSSLARQGRRASQDSISRASGEIQDLLRRSPWPWRLRRAMLIAWRHMQMKTGGGEIVILPSLTGPDDPLRDCRALHTRSKPIANRRDHLRAIREAWCDHFSPEALSQRLSSPREVERPGLALVLHPCIPAMWSGFAASHDPITDDATLVEAFPKSSDPSADCTTPLRFRMPWRSERRGDLLSQEMSGAGASGSRAQEILTWQTTLQLIRMARMLSVAMGVAVWFEWHLDETGGIHLMGGGVRGGERTIDPRSTGPWEWEPLAPLFPDRLSPLEWSLVEPMFTEAAVGPHRRNPMPVAPLCRLIEGRVHIDIGALRALAALRDFRSSQRLWGGVARDMRALERQVNVRHRRRVHALMRRVEEFSTMPNERLAEWIRRLTMALRSLHAPWALLLPRRQMRRDQLIEIIQRTHGRQDPQALLGRLLRIESAAGGETTRRQESESEWRRHWLGSLGPQDRITARIATEELRRLESLLRREAEAIALHGSALNSWLDAVHSRLGVMAQDDLPWLRAEEIADALIHPGRRHRLAPLIGQRRRSSSASPERGEERHRESAVTSDEEESASIPPRGAKWNASRSEIASPGHAEGCVRHLAQPGQLGALRSDEIAMVPDCDPRWAWMIGECRGIVVRRGAVMSPLARACRQAGMPMIILSDSEPTPSQGSSLAVTTGGEIRWSQTHHS